jgi:hypothetical protein
MPLPSRTVAKAAIRKMVVEDHVFQVLALLTVGIVLTGIIMYVMTAVWMLRLQEKNCDCANDWRKYVILVFPPVAWLASAFVHHWSVALLTTSLWIAFIVITHQYIRLLKKRNCVCSKAGDVPIHVMAWFPVAMFAMFVLMMAVIVVKLYHRRALLR